MAKLLLTGGTGFIGRSLCSRLLQKGYEVHLLTRSPEKIDKLFKPSSQGVVSQGSVHRGVSPKGYFWDGCKTLPPQEALKGVEYVLHLAGEGVADAPWTKKRKQLIWDSRILSTQNLLQGLKLEKVYPKVFLSASAIGYYGDGGETELTEEKGLKGKDFLSDLCFHWEKAVKEISSFSETRCLSLRSGLVLSSEGGFLKKILPFFRKGLGGPLGNGQQWMSWIHLQDMISLLLFALKEEKLQGVVNAVSPNPVRNKTFSKTLGKFLKRPALLPTPTLALKMFYGKELSSLICSSQRVRPQKLIDQNFSFSFPHLKDALAHEFS